MKKSVKVRLVYCDGGCFGNGTNHAESYGSFTVFDGDGTKIAHERIDYPSIDTNNEAEYIAFLRAAQYISENDKFGILWTIHSDSQLVVNGITNGWKVNAPNLKPLNALAKMFMRDHKNVQLIQVPREQIAKILGH